MIAALFARLFRSGPGADLRAAQDGDRAAIGRFYDAHVDGLYTFVFYRVGRDAGARRGRRAGDVRARARDGAPSTTRRAARSAAG